MECAPGIGRAAASGASTWRCASARDGPCQAGPSKAVRSWRSSRSSSADSLNATKPLRRLTTSSGSGARSPARSRRSARCASLLCLSIADALFARITSHGTPSTGRDHNWSLLCILLRAPRRQRQLSSRCSRIEAPARRWPTVGLRPQRPCPVSAPHARPAGTVTGCDRRCLVLEEHAIPRIAARQCTESGRTIEPTVELRLSVSAV